MHPNVEETQAGVLLDGRYRLIRRIGEGRAALVWLADDLLDRSHAAVKILHPHLRLRAEPRNRFAHEAGVLAELGHPSIVRAKSFNLESSRPYIALEYREGASLDQELRARKAKGQFFEVQTVLAVIRDVAAALDAVHARGIVHRDLQPANIMVVRSGSRIGAYLFDFGIAQLVGESGEAEAGAAGKLTANARYMAPEQARGENIDRRADVYTLGLLAYQLLTLERPWGENLSVAAMIAAAADGPRLSAHASRPSISSRVDAVLARATAADRAERFESAGAFAAELSRVAGGASWVERVLRPEVLFVAGGIAAAAALTVFAPRWSSTRQEASVPDEARPVLPAISARVPVEVVVETDEELPPDEAPRLKKARAAKTRGSAVSEAEAKPGDRFAALREAIARAEAAPEDAARFRAASAQLRARVLALESAGRDGAGRDTTGAPARVARLKRLLEVAELSYDHGALAQIADELEELDR